ncbi:MAG: hypothetical protein NT147_09670, partial [Candidatus Aminicenantes bacterium]|nr:hypothetical protein [Candidatus Aminicenantes bacterium]
LFVTIDTAMWPAIHSWYGWAGQSIVGSGNSPRHYGRKGLAGERSRTMTSSCFMRIIRPALAGLAILAAFPASFFTQQTPQPEHVPCRDSLKAYILDKSLNARWGEDNNTVIMKMGGVEVVCRCASLSALQSPECKPTNSSGTSGLEGVDFSRFNPGQRLALQATQSLIQGLFNSIFGADKPAGAAEDALIQRQAMLKKQQEETVQARNDWNLFQEQEKARVQREQEANRMTGKNLLEKMGGAGGQGLGYQSISGEKLEFNDWMERKPEANPLPPGKYPALKSAIEQVRCAAYFSERARELSGLGKNEEAKFMSLQAEKAMAGEPLDAPCQASAAGAGAGSGADPQKAGPQAVAMGINEILDQYKAKIQELLKISQDLGAIREQKLTAQDEIKRKEAEIMDIKSRAAAATKPEEKKECEDLLRDALALKGQSEDLLKIATQNEEASKAYAEKAKRQVQELSSKLKESKDKK